MKCRDLNVWQRSVALSSQIYMVLADLKDYGFKDQITRSGLSVPSNIAEGIERVSDDNLGYSVGKINYILKALMAKGLIKAENFATSSNKKQYRYLLTREGIEEKVTLTEKFIERKKREYEELQTELERMREVDHG